jgi:hypothetical protein
MGNWSLIKADKPSYWLGPKQIDKIACGEVRGMDEIDLAAIQEGQAAKKMRQYSQRVRKDD